MAESKKSGSEGREIERQHQVGGLARREQLFPSLFSLTPSDFFTMSPFALMRRFSDEMDRTFAGWTRGETGQATSWSPAIEVSRKGGDLVVCAELPGMKKDEVRVEVTDEGLVIEGERRREEERRAEGYLHSERSYGRFHRLIPLPEDAKIDQAHASFRDGVLEVRVPVPEQKERRRQIPITISTEAQAQHPGMRVPEPAAAGARAQTSIESSQRTGTAGSTQQQK